MDSATATIGRSADLRRDRDAQGRDDPDPDRRRPRARRPYTERTIERDNTWTWSAGRRVYELLAPDGSNYVMQSYSQIRDPAADDRRPARRSARGSSCRRAGRYRVERLQRDLDADGRAARRRSSRTSFTNTYQRLPAHAAAPSSTASRSPGSTRAVDSPAPGTLHDAGTISGKPFGPRDGRHPGHVRAGLGGDRDLRDRTPAGLGVRHRGDDLRDHRLGDNVHRDGDVHRRDGQVPRDQGDRRRFRPQHARRPERDRDARRRRQVLTR